MSTALTKYRWPVLLLMGVPAIQWIVSRAVLLYSDVRGLDWGFNTVVAGASFLALTILALSYLRVRRMDRPFLIMVWGYALAVSCISAPVSLVAAVLVEGYSFRDWTTFFYAASLMGLLGFVVIGVFARRASRISLPHAFFLYLVLASLDFDIPWIESSSFYLRQLEWFLWVCLDIFLVWLLGNFDTLSDRFRRRAVTGLAALYLVNMFMLLLVASAVDPMPILWIQLSLLFIVLISVALEGFPLVLIYLVRVRKAGSVTSTDTA